MDATAAGATHGLSMHMALPSAARPSVAQRSGTHRSSYNVDWAEDDAWDSGSDSETPHPRQPSPLNSRIQSAAPAPATHPPISSTSAPRPVPRPAMNSSSSTLSSSYTHLHAPSPSSYPRADESPPIKNGWTVVRKSMDQRGVPAGGGTSTPEAGPEVDGVVVVGEEAEPPMPGRAKQNPGVVRADVQEIVNDPLLLVTAARPAQPDPPVSADEPPHKVERLAREKSIKTNRRRKFVDSLSSTEIEISTLRKLGWAGIPNDLRPVAWPLLLGYMPLPLALRASTLQRKRAEYASLVELTFNRGKSGLDQQIWHQIEIDVPRTRPGVPLWMYAPTQRSLERILYVWAIRHPASGYVQGINDLATPFYQVFLSAYIDSDPEDFDPGLLPPEAMSAVEADTFWCLSRLLDGIQDNYIAGQPGIQRSVRRMSELVGRIDPPLAAHLASQNVEFMQFAFRWMNCLLMREISVENTIRMWDTYLAEGTEAFSQFHLYVCAAFLVRWSDKLQDMDFQGVIMFLQSLPTQDWTDNDIELLLSRAFVLSSTWHNAQSHFQK